MKPEVDQILGLSSGQLMSQIAPLLPNSFAVGGASLLGIMMTLAAQEYERGADIRAAENADMRSLFRDAAAQIADAELKAMVSTAAATQDRSLKISALNAENIELRRVLIRLQAYAEMKGLRDIERRIWDVLKASADRRILRLG
ncbi:MAG TPA: hypothetical protein VMD53_04825 [Rhizomicrobium sp.]|nr:hypothetical protein [Rhizomicrobium sp.]